MKLSAKLMLSMFALIATACGASRTAPLAVSDGQAPGRSAPAGYGAPNSAGMPASPAAQAEASSAKSSSEDSSSAQPSERPGLGTSWGEDRNSRVETTSFYRADPTNPFTTVAVYYNDETGVQAMISGGRPNYFDNSYPAWNRALTVTLLDETHRPLRSASVGGRTYVVGENGQRYLISIRNNSSNRTEVVATVDGLDVVDGQPGSFQKRGYILGPYASLEIEGFRRSQETVASFRFGSVRDSYAERKGEGRNVGVIGVAFFAEQGSNWQQWTPEEVQRRQDADPFPGRYAQPPR